MAHFRRILVPVDFSKHADAALDLAIELAKESGAEIHLVHAYELPSSVTLAYGVAIPQSVWDGVQEAATAKLNEALARTKAAGVVGTTHLLTAPAADAIAETAAAHAVDLIVMGTRGRSGITRMFLGSVAERVLRRALQPVFVTQPG